MSGPSVISISSHVSRGSVGNRASVFALETLGVHAWVINTLSLPWHPGHGPSTKIVPPIEQFSSYLNDIAKAPWVGEINAVLTGYMATAEQVDEVASFIQTLKRDNPKLLYLCDPVMGDHSGLYVDPAIAESMREELVPLSNITTPNLYELSWLCGVEMCTRISDLVDMALTLKPSMVVTTSAPGLMRNTVSNLCVAKHKAFMMEHKMLPAPPSGTGDLTAALLLAHILLNKTPQEAMRLTTASVFEIISKSKSYDSDELMLEFAVDSIVSPRTLITTRFLSGGSK